MGSKTITDYSKYVPGFISVEKIDTIAASFLTGQKDGIIALIVTCMKMFILVAWWWMRKDIIAKQEKIDHQIAVQNGAINDEHAVEDKP